MKQSESGGSLSALAGKFISTLSNNKSKVNSPCNSLQDIYGTYKKEIQASEKTSNAARRSDKRPKIKRSKSSTDGVRGSSAKAELKGNAAFSPIRRVRTRGILMVDTKTRGLAHNAKSSNTLAPSPPPSLLKARSSGGKSQLPPPTGLPIRTKSLPLKLLKSAELPRPIKGILKMDHGKSSSSSSSSSKSKSLLQGVEFDVTEVREYPYILDKSRTDQSVMLTIAWMCQSQKLDSVDEFEMQKAFCKSVGLRSKEGARRYKIQERAGILLRSGWTVSDLGKELNAAQQSLERAKDDKGKSVHPLKKLLTLSKKKITSSASA